MLKSKISLYITAFVSVAVVVSAAVGLYYDAIRASAEEKQPVLEASGAYRDHEYIDLGLSVLWSTRNMGAQRIEDYGDYYAWGELRVKQDYRWQNYRWSRGRYDLHSKYVTDSRYGLVDSLTMLDSADDVAHRQWGGRWRLPTQTEIDELIQHCTWTWMSINDHFGYKVTSNINGAKMFLPAAGYYNDTILHDLGEFGNYWTSSLYERYSYYAWQLLFSPVRPIWFNGYRHCGMSIRPVYQRPG